MGRYVQINVPLLATEPAPLSDPTVYDPVTDKDAFPILGVFIGQTSLSDSVFTVALSSTLPNHDHFERRLGLGSWQTASGVDTLPVGACTVEYRSVDALGNLSAVASLNVWAPRSDDFIKSANPTSIRARTVLCLS
jgi:hypothetical protein